MKKRINIVLILIVLVVWGFVASKTLSRYFFSEKKTTNTKKNNSSLNINMINKDTFLINNIERDPFLNKESRINITPQKNPYLRKPILKKKTKTIKQKEILNWPLISYHGYINSKDKNNELLILVNVNKKLHKLRLNVESEGIIVTKIFKDSIELNFNTEKKIFKLNL